MYKKSAAPQMNSIRAQIMSCTHKKSNSGLSSSLESAGFLCTIFFTFILRNGKKKDLLNLNSRGQINKIECMGWFFGKIFLEM